MKITKAVLLQSIRESSGQISEIARRHGMTYYGVQKRIKSDPELADALEDTRETLLDIAEHQLIEAIKAGNLQAAKFYLETKGKSRGYGRHAEIIKPEPHGQVVIYIPDNGRSQPASAPVS
jgi:hypothetical protein